MGHGEFVRLFYCDSFCRHTKRERRFVVDGRDNEIALSDDIHADEYIVVEIAVVLAAEHAKVGNLIAVLEAEVNEVGVYVDDAVQRGDGVLVARLQAQRGDYLRRDNRIGRPRVPRGVLNLAVAAVAVGIGHTVWHDHEAVGDDGILPTAEVLLQNTHRGRMFDVMTRCVLGVCGTERVVMNRATCPSAQGSAWTVTVILGKFVLSIIAIIV